MMRKSCRNSPSPSHVLIDEEDGIQKYHSVPNRRGRYYVGAAVMLCAFVVFVVTSSTSSSTSIGSLGQMMGASSCTIQDCSLEVISLLKNGRKHACKEFCSEQVQWTKSNMKTVEVENEGAFTRHGICKEQQELVLMHGEDEDEVPKLIARESKGGLPDYASIVSSIQGKTILVIGDSTMKQHYEALPIVLPDSKHETTAYMYNASSADGVELVSHCDLDFKSHSQSCRKGGGARFACTCTVISTLNVADHTVIQYAQGYGIEFENSNGKAQVYGVPKDFNIVKPALYKKLAETASTIVVTSGVINHVTDHDKEGYVALTQSVKRWSKDVGSHQQLVFSLTMPQHFSTKAPHSTYLDEERGPGNCVEVAERHWSHALAFKAFRGSDVDVIDTFPYLSKYGRFHSKQPGDCGDWCLGYDMFYAFWRVLAEAVA